METARLTMTSMYSQLLAATMEGQHPDEADAPPSSGELLSRVLSCRRHLDHPGSPTVDGHAVTTADGAVGPAGDLAANVAYDMALLALCAARGIDSDPAMFGRPLVERSRLEAALAAQGLDLDVLERER